MPEDDLDNEDNQEGDATGRKRKKRTNTKPLSVVLDADFHRNLEIEAAKSGMNKSDYVIKALTKELYPEEDEEEDEEGESRRIDLSTFGGDNMGLTEGERKLIVSDVVAEIEKSIEKGLGKEIQNLSTGIDSVHRSVASLNQDFSKTILEQLDPKISRIEGNSTVMCKNGECSNNGITQVLEKLTGIEKSMGGVCEGIDCLKEDAFSVNCPECGKKFTWTEGMDHCPHCGVPVELDNS